MASDNGIRLHQAYASASNKRILKRNPPNKKVAAQFQDLKPTRQQQLPATEATTVGEVGIRRRRRAAVGAAGV
jgi:hypothetical protein